MLESGLDDTDILAVLQKPAYVMMARDSMAMARLRKQKQKVKGKRVINVSRVRKSAGTSKTTSDASTDTRARLRKRVRQTGDQAAAEQLIESILQ